MRRGPGLDLPGIAHGRYGLRRHYRVEPWTDFVEVHWSGHGEALLAASCRPGAARLIGPAASWMSPAFSAAVRHLGMSSS
ncbi:hypothetical protein GCM10009612_29400 [Streptomyces beijiangensis]